MCVYIYMVLCIDGIEEMFYIMLDVQYNIVYVYIYNYMYYIIAPCTFNIDIKNGALEKVSQLETIS